MAACRVVQSPCWERRSVGSCVGADGWFSVRAPRDRLPGRLAGSLVPKKLQGMTSRKKQQLADNSSRSTQPMVCVNLNPTARWRWRKSGVEERFYEERECVPLSRPLSRRSPG